MHREEKEVENGNEIVTIKKKVLRFNSEFFEHSHRLFNTKIKMTPEMEKELLNFDKKTSIKVIKSFMNKKFNARFTYMDIYNMWRKLYPRFKQNDANSFVKILKKANCIVEVEKIEGNLEKIIFATEIMKERYVKYNDIVIVDSTFKTNTYNLPFVIFSGANNKGHNIIFAIGLISNEKAESYVWLFRKFMLIHSNIQPRILVTDQDLAVDKAKNLVWHHSVRHLLCRWHIGQNIKKKFCFLKSEEDKKIRERILQLRYMETPEDFNDSFNQIKSYFVGTRNEVETHSYLDMLFGIKEQFSQAYIGNLFTAGIYVTSRVEAINNIVKKHLKASSELVAIIDFLEEFEGAFSLRKPESVKRLITHPILSELSSLLHPKLLSLYKSEMDFSFYYTGTAFTDIEGGKFFEVTAKEGALTKRIVQFKDGELKCSCKLLEQEGIVCRHLFAIKNLLQSKNLSFLNIRQRWLKSYHLEDEMR